MASLNKVFLIGNLTRDPEVRFIPSGTAVAEFGLAINETYRNREGQDVETTVFVDVVVWARQAETCGEYLSKGSPVMIEGRLQLDQWESREGEKRSKLRVRADRVQFLGSPRRGAEFADGDQTPSGAGAVAAAPAAPSMKPQDRDDRPPPATAAGEDFQHDNDDLPF